MGNFSFTVGTNYNPFTFQEISAAPLLYKAEYDKQSEELGKLQEQASVWDSMVSEEEDPYAYAKLQQFKDNLKNISDGLAMRGLGGNYRQQLINSKSDFAKRIKPIETAFAKKTALSEEQRKAQLGDPSLYFERQAKDMSLDTFIDNPNADYGKSLSVDKFQKEIWDVARVISEQSRNGKIPAEVMANWLPGLIGYNTKNGLSVEMVMREIAKGAENGQLGPAFSGLIKKYGTGWEDINGNKVMDGWGYDSLYNAMRGALDYSAYGMIGKDQFHVVADPAYDKSAGSRASTESVQHFPVNTRLYGLVNNNTDWKSMLQSKANALKILKDYEGGVLKINSDIYKDPTSGWFKPNRPAYNNYTSPQDAAYKPELPEIKTTHIVNHKLSPDTYDIHFSDSNGNILTKDEFIKQGVDTNDKIRLSKLYDDKIITVLKQEGIDINKSTGTVLNVNAAELLQKYNDYIENIKNPYLVERTGASIPIANLRKLLENRSSFLEYDDSGSPVIQLLEGIDDFNAPAKLSETRVSLDDFFGENESAESDLLLPLSKIDPNKFKPGYMNDNIPIIGAKGQIGVIPAKFFGEGGKNVIRDFNAQLNAIYNIMAAEAHQGTLTEEKEYLYKDKMRRIAEIARAQIIQYGFGAIKRPEADILGTAKEATGNEAFYGDASSTMQSSTR